MKGIHVSWSNDSPNAKIKDRNVNHRAVNYFLEFLLMDLVFVSTIDEEEYDSISTPNPHQHKSILMAYP